MSVIVIVTKNENLCIEILLSRLNTFLQVIKICIVLNLRDFKYESRVHFVKFLGSLDYKASMISEYEW